MAKAVAKKAAPKKVVKKVIKKTAKKAAPQKKVAVVNLNKQASKCLYQKLWNGHKIPTLGLGTFLNKTTIKDIVKHAILVDGYRHIDCAKVYDNEEQVGEALKECFAAGIKREDLFITSKLWHDDKNQVEKALDACLKRLGLKYLDLYLIHWMRADVDWKSKDWKIRSPPHHKVWADMEKLVKKGKIRSIGVSNCPIPMLYDLLAGCTIKPAVNQVECHPYNQHQVVIDFHKRYGVMLQAHSSIGSGHWNLRQKELEKVSSLDDPVIKAIAKRTGHSPAQVILAWHMQRGVNTLVSSTKIERLGQNYAAQWIKLSDADRKKIDALDKGIKLYNPRYINGFDWGVPDSGISMPYFD